MKRSLVPEIMDDPAVSPKMVKAFHDDLARLGKLLGNNRHVVELVKRARPASVLDIGCGQGALLAKLHETLGVAVTGVDLRPSPPNGNGIAVMKADATKDPLPVGDLALCVLVAHHLDEGQVVELVRNVGRYCKRLTIVDLVRHPVPLALFSLFLWPFMSRLVFLDGQQSIRRAYTPEELRSLVVRGIAGTGSTFTHWVSPIYGKQTVEITYRA